MRTRLFAFVTSAALHLALALSFLEPAPVIAAVAPPRATVEIVTAPAEDAAYPGLNPLETPEDRPSFRAGRTSLTFNNTTFDVSKIAERFQVLFPFLTPGLSLDLFALTPQNEFDRFLNTLRQQSRQTKETRTVPLALGIADLQKLIDRTWSRRDRWQALQPLLELANTHDASVGDVPTMFRAYGEQNMGQYYEDRNRSARDPRLWTELALAADHVSFISFVRRYASEHPSTKGTIELLFILDKVVEGNRNILATLRSTEPRTQLNDTQITAPDAYAVILKIQRYYAQVLDDRHLRTPEDVSTVYAGVRLRVLNGVLATTPDGYRASDARFLIGSIHWHAGHISDALTSWCGMAPDPTDVYADLSSRTLAVLRAPAGPAGNSCTTGTLAVAVSRTLEALLAQEESRSWNAQYERLRHFGYTVDTF